MDYTKNQYFELVFNKIGYFIVSWSILGYFLVLAASVWRHFLNRITFDGTVTITTSFDAAAPKHVQAVAADQLITESLFILLIISMAIVAFIEFIWKGRNRTLTFILFLFLGSALFIYSYMGLEVTDENVLRGLCMIAGPLLLKETTDREQYAIIDEIINDSPAKDFLSPNEEIENLLPDRWKKYLVLEKRHLEQHDYPIFRIDHSGIGKVGKITSRVTWLTYHKNNRIVFRLRYTPFSISFYDRFCYDPMPEFGKSGREHE